jgi:hypothetical protein
LLGDIELQTKFFFFGKGDLAAASASMDTNEFVLPYFEVMILQ